MEFNEILSLVTSLPVWVYVVAGLVLVIFLGDRELWDYEVKFPREPGVGRGEIEFEGYKKRGTVLEAKFNLDPACQGLVMEIYLAGKLVHTIPPAKTRGGRVFVKEKVRVDEPGEGAEVKVKIGGQERFSGRLVRD